MFRNLKRISIVFFLVLFSFLVIAASYQDDTVAEWNNGTLDGDAAPFVEVG